MSGMLTRYKELLSPPVFENEEEALAASLLHTILLILAAAGFVVPLVLNVVAVVDPGDDVTFNFSTMAMGLIVPGLALWLLQLARRGRVQLAGAIMTATLFLLTTSTIVTFRGTRDTAAGMYILVIAMAGLLLGGRAAIVFTALSLSATFLVYLAETSGALTITLSERPGLVEWIIFAVVLFLIGILLRFAFETLNRALRQAREANEELERVQASLADRVAARTRDLELAADIGRNLSRVRESEEILLEAVELIRSRFDLYYTQIYLIDPTGSNLVLRAGTGAVGRQLRQLGHRLPLSTSSINGTAVTKQQPVIVADTAESGIFRQNPLLPDTRSEMAVPLIVSEKVIGSLNLQSDKPGALTTENLSAFEALAGQLAVALENARLFTETVETQGALESLAQRLTRSGWESYLNAIDRQENIRYTYDLTRNMISEPPAEAANYPSLAVPIRLGQEDLGRIEVMGNEWHVWQKEHEELAAAVAQRVAQQIENLRLLSEADKYRTEAEEATRRLTREGWETFIHNQMAQPDGYVYDRQEVKPLNGGNGRHQEPALAQTLTVRGEPIGRLEIDDVAPDADEAASELIAAVAERLSAHIENLRLANQTESALVETERRAEELAVINELARTVSQQMDLEQILQTVYEQVRRVMSADAFFVGLYDHETNLIEYPIVYDEGVRYEEGIHDLDRDTSVFQVLKTGESLVVAYEPDEKLPSGKVLEKNAMGNESKPSRSMMFVPLIFSNKTVGIISVQSYEYNAYGDADLTLVGGIASHVSVAIQNARLFSQTQQRAEELAVVNEIAHAVSGQLAQQELLATVYQQIQRIMKVDAFTVTAYDPAAQMLHYLLVMDEGKQFQEEPTSLGKGAISRVITEGQPILFNRTQAELEELDRKRDLKLLGNVQRYSASLLYVPLQIGSEIIGSMSVQSYELNAYGQAETDLLIAVANHVAVALENANLFEETQTTLAETELLYNMGTHINRAATLEDLVAVAGIPGIAPGATSAGLFRFETGKNGEAEWMELAANWAGEGKAVLPVGTRLYLPEIPMAAAALYTPNEPMLITDIDQDERIDEEAKFLLKGLNTKAMAIIPMQQLGNWIGTLIIRWQASYAFSARERRLYNSLARQMSTALSNQVLLTATQERAAQLEKIAQVETALSQAADEIAILEALALLADESQIMSLHYTLEEEYQPQTLYTVAHWEKGEIRQDDEFLYKPFDVSAHAGFSMGVEQPNRVSYISNVQSDARVKKPVAEESAKWGFDSVLIVPLRSAGRWQGFISVKWPDTHEFSDEEVDVWEKLRESLAAIVASRRAYLAQQDALSETAVLYETGAQLSVASNFDEVLNVIRKNTILGHNVSNVSVMLFDSEQDRGEKPAYAEVLAFWSPEMPENPVNRFYFNYYPSAEKVLQIASSNPVIFDDVPNSPIMDDRLKQMLIGGFNTNTYAVFPMVVRGEWIGYVNAMFPQPTEFSEKDIRRAEAVIQQASIAVQGLRNLELAEHQALVAQNRSNELASINRVVSTIVSILDLDEMLEMVAGELIELFAVQHVGIALINEDRTALKIVADRSSIPKAESAVGLEISLAGNVLSNQVIETRKPVVVENAQTNPLTEPVHDVMRWRGTEVLILLPLISGRETVGTLGLDITEKDRTFTDAELQLAETIVAQIATAVENIQLFDQTESRARELAVLNEESARLFVQAQARSEELVILNEMGRSLTALVDMDSILDNIYRYTARLMDAGNFYIAFWDRKRDEITFALDIRGERVMRNAGTRKAGKGLTERIIHTKEPILIPEKVDLKLAELGIEQIGPQAASWLGVPLMVGTQVIGVIGLQNWDKPGTYNEQHLRLLTSVAGQAAIAIENARLFEQIQARARRERILREVTAKVRGATDADSVMQTAVQEIGRALGKQTYVYLNPNQASSGQEPVTETMKEEAYGD